MLEQVVRPVQAPATLRFGSIPVDDTKQAPEAATIRWGQVGDLPTAQEETTAEDGTEFKVIDCDDKFAEKQRTVSKIRVENPDDPDQYVMVERVDRISFRHFERPTAAAISPADKTTTQYASADAVRPAPYGVLIDESKLCKNTYALYNKTAVNEKLEGSPTTRYAPKDFTNTPPPATVASTNPNTP
jgi:hypothetical protein